jgi:hypothetical protein
MHVGEGLSLHHVPAGHLAQSLMLWAPLFVPIVPAGHSLHDAELFLAL